MSKKPWKVEPMEAERKVECSCGEPATYVMYQENSSSRFQIPKCSKCLQVHADRASRWGLRTGDGVRATVTLECPECEITMTLTFVPGYPLPEAICSCGAALLVFERPPMSPREPDKILSGLIEQVALLRSKASETEETVADIRYELGGLDAALNELGRTRKERA